MLGDCSLSLDLAYTPRAYQRKLNPTQSSNSQLTEAQLARVEG